MSEGNYALIQTEALQKKKNWTQRSGFNFFVFSSSFFFFALQLPEERAVLCGSYKTHSVCSPAMGGWRETAVALQKYPEFLRRARVLL